ncbi:VOC family protein [Actinophytocola sp. NPDC049390]|uniref:VOC family protein n=1 Tax=Actinophytocola sp. NPDC049390 TaxID=3363894 RepID=UPI0037B40B63
MKLTFLFQPVPDLEAAVAFYRDELGLDESWREGKTTAAFRLPDSEIELMLVQPPDDGPKWRAGGFFGVESVDKFMTDHPDFTWLGDVEEVPGGRTVSFQDPSGNAVHIFDQTDPEPTD